ncbi:MAG: L-serine ammonia-lyase, iron-sulfur-dependent, subunit alpha [Bacillota bacterium]|nr:L-serine ammonia-lyase, iron-sulfur-dependent, subunit alpha [Bacillota bacterium]
MSDIKTMILEFLRNEVVPAVGCTEPAAIALAGAKASELLNISDYREIDSVNLIISPNIFKNAMGVGIPNTDEIGINIAAALGVVHKGSEEQLNIFQNVTREDAASAKNLINDGKLTVELKDTDKKIYIEMVIKVKNQYSRVIIEDMHNKFVLLEKNDEILFSMDRCDENDKVQVQTCPCQGIYDLTIKNIVDEVQELSYEDLRFLEEGLIMNMKIAKSGILEPLGVGIGYQLQDSMINNKIESSYINRSIALVAAASDARMKGTPLPVMSSNGSGNMGLVQSIPLYKYKEEFNADELTLLKALALSHIITGYIKHYTGRLSPLCGAATAAGIGLSSAYCMLMDGGYEGIKGAIKNMVGDVSGMICDGAKSGCALKSATAVSTAYFTAILACSKRVIPNKNGIIEENLEETIKHMGEISASMTKTDKVILNIMQKINKEG